MSVRTFEQQVSVLERCTNVILLPYRLINIHIIMTNMKRERSALTGMEFNRSNGHLSTDLINDIAYIDKLTSLHNH